MNKSIKHFFMVAFVFILGCELFGAAWVNDAVVSYYAEDFHGKKTSSGETFNMNDYTCASKELPFNTRLKLTNLANGKTVEVRVNDRGPFVANRELDLSKAAAVKLDMIKSGTAHVKIEVLEWGPDSKISQQTADKAIQMMAKSYPEWKPHGRNNAVASKTEEKKSPAKSTSVKTTSSAKTTGSAEYWDIQLGAFSTRSNANVLAQKLLKDGFENVVFQKTETVIRVVIREVPAKDLENMEKKLQKHGYTDYTVRARKIKN